MGHGNRVQTPRLLLFVLFLPRCPVALSFLCLSRSFRSGPRLSISTIPHLSPCIDGSTWVFFSSILTLFRLLPIVDKHSKYHCPFLDTRCPTLVIFCKRGVQPVLVLSSPFFMVSSVILVQRLGGDGQKDKDVTNLLTSFFVPTEPGHMLKEKRNRIKTEYAKRYTSLC
ncbi:MAG: hypothetical protein BYD32DRAFT_148554 [Podila humilis]|nr:MAG: hypothetical protein BYD32DRAFT_148554 [Podila humilis]